MTTSIFEVRKQLSQRISKGQLDRSTVEILFQGNEPLEVEDDLWDFKYDFTKLAIGQNKRSSQAGEYEEIIKDIVAFYNSLGGLVVFGIQDNPRTVVGMGATLDPDTLSQKIRQYTNQQIHFNFGTFVFNGKTLGALLIPRRPDNVTPVQFKKSAKIPGNGKRAFQASDIYIRRGPECRPATSSEDLEFLFKSSRRVIGIDESYATSVLDHNLRERDPTFIEFVGREEYLRTLWRWLLDRFNTVKVLSGFGGVGKTTIAREFAEEVVETAPAGFQKVIWFTAKQMVYQPLDGGRQTAPISQRPHFGNVSELLKQMLSELGSLESEINDIETEEEINEKCIEVLSITPTFVAIDDVDTLDVDSQYELFHRILLIFGQTLARSSTPSRALLTARQDLGAAPQQKIHVTGFNLEEFSRFIEMLVEKYDIHSQFLSSDKLVRRFHKVSDGSPLFAAAILNLVKYGQSLDTALKRWEGSDGIDVRRFAFEREIDSLTDSQRRTLYAACCLSETSFAELASVTGSPHSLLTDDLTELRKYHLISRDSGAPRGGASLFVPSGIRLLSDLLRQKLSDPTRIETDCKKARSVSKQAGTDAAAIIRRVVSLWQEGFDRDALDVAVWGDKQARGKNPDLKCLLGRAYLRVEPQDFRKADANFRKAWELKCSRPELFDLWVETKQHLQDWRGIVDISADAEKEKSESKFIVARGEAYAQLAQTAEINQDHSTALSYLRTGARDMRKAFDERRAIGNVQEILDLKSRLYIRFVEKEEELTDRDDDALNIWLAAVEAYNAHVRRSFLLRKGTVGLCRWWQFVKYRRNTIQKSTADKLEEQLNKLDGLKEDLIDKEWKDASLVEEINHTRDWLAREWTWYVAELRG